MNNKTTSEPVDMSPEAITQRLRNVSDLAEFCLILKHARPVSAEDAKQLGPRKRPVSQPSNEDAK